MANTIPHPDRRLHGDDCPGCHHALGLHAIELGCSHGWFYDRCGVVQTDGCECPLTLAKQHDPAHEWEV